MHVEINKLISKIGRTAKKQALKLKYEYRNSLVGALQTLVLL